jgi:hypothetical protein
MVEIRNPRAPSKAVRLAVFGRFNTCAGDVADIAIHESYLTKVSRRPVGLEDWLRLATDIATKAAPPGSQLAALTAIGVGAPPLGLAVADWWKDEDFESKHPRNPKGHPDPGQFRSKTPEEITQGKARLAGDMRRVQARQEIRIVVMHGLAAAVEAATTPIPVLGQIDDALAVANIAAAIKEFHDLAVDVAAAVDFLRKAPYTLDQLRVSPDSVSFPSYKEFCKVDIEKRFRRAGDGLEYHHIVEQGGDNEDNIPPEQLHSTDNIIKLPTIVHEAITAEYTTPQDEYGGMTLREYLRGKPYEVQYEEGIKVLRKLSIIQ